MKRVRRQRESWHVPPPPPQVAVFQCSGCGAVLTGPLRRIDDRAALSEKELAPLVPAGAYWPVAVGHLPMTADGRPVDFTGTFAVRPDALVGVGVHPERVRWIGCCGPSGTGGLNRVCACGRAVGTERSDCLWPVAVYFDPQAVRPQRPEVEPDADADPAGR